MEDKKYTEEFQKALNDYIKLGFNQDECNGFMHGFHKGAEAEQLNLTSVGVSETELVCKRVNNPDNNRCITCGAKAGSKCYL